MSDLPPVVGRATEYQFHPPSQFEGDPMDHALEYNPKAITVSWRGGDRWAILHGAGWSPGQVWCEWIGDWEFEPSPSNRDDDFIARTRYSEAEALAIAERLANALSSDEGQT